MKLHACVRGSSAFESNQMPLLPAAIMGEILPDCPSAHVMCPAVARREITGCKINFLLSSSPSTATISIGP